MRRIIVQTCVLLSAANAARASLVDLINPGFEQPLAVGWTIGGCPTNPNPDVPAGCADRIDDGSGDHLAVFGEVTPSAYAFLYQDITIGASDNILTFDYFIDTLGSFNGTALRDAFSARILDPVTFQPIFYSPGRKDFFYHQVPDPAGTPTDVLFYDDTLVGRDLLIGNPFRPGWYQVSADISALQGQTVRLEFGLLRGDNGQTTFAAIDNIVPEPATVSLLIGAGLLLGRRRG